MPWRHVEVMKERLQFVRDARRRLVSFTELCAMYQISRPVGYKWLHRAEQSGMPLGRTATTNSARDIDTNLPTTAR